MGQGNVPLVVPARYPQLYTAVRDTAQQMIYLLRRALADPPQWPARSAQHVVFRNGGNAGTEEVVEECPGDAISRVYAELAGTEEFRQAVRELERLAAEGRAIPHFFGVERTYLTPILTSYLDLQRSLDFDEGKFRVAYYQVEDYLGAETASTRLYLELRGLSGSLDEVILSETHRIYRLDEAEVNRLWRRMVPHAGYPFVGSFRVWPPLRSYVLEGTIRYPKGEAGDLGVFINDENVKATRTLRLSAAGAGPVRLLTYEPVGFSPEMGRFMFPELIQPGKYLYELDEGSSAEIKKHWPYAYDLASSLQKAPDKLPTHLRISGLRFSNSFDKPANEDQLIDYSIAFEALFTKENDAVSYRLPLRAAIFVGDTPDERRKVFAVAHAAYVQRSNLAHGHNQLEDRVKVGAAKMSAAELLRDLQSILFKSIHRFLQCSKTSTKDVILRAIDNAVISMDRSELTRLWS